MPRRYRQSSTSEGLAQGSYVSATSPHNHWFIKFQKGFNLDLSAWLIIQASRTAIDANTDFALLIMLKSQDNNYRLTVDGK